MNPKPSADLLGDLRMLIEGSRHRAADILQRELVPDLQARPSPGRLGPDLVFRDPTVLDRLGLRPTHGPAGLRSTVLRDLETFLLGSECGFSLVARDQQVSSNHSIDLLFFHRALRATIAVVLDLGDNHGHDQAGLEQRLRWLEQNDRRQGEAPPLGLLLRVDGVVAMAELWELRDGAVLVASYPAELPLRELLERKLLDSLTLARGLSTRDDREVSR